MRARHLPPTLRVAVALVAAAAPPPAALAATGPHGDHAAARAFAHAADELQAAVNAQRTVIARAYAHEHLNRCLLTRNPPRSAQRRATALVLLGYEEPVIEHTRPALRRFVARLERVRTRDPILEQGRAAWRRSTQLLEGVPHVDDPCGALVAWQHTRWRSSAAPRFDVGAVLRAEFDTESAAPLARTARRLRRLGIPAPEATRFEGTHLYDAVAPNLLADTFGITSP